MRILLLYLFLMLFSSIHAQTSADKINSNIKNVKTKNHMNILGTRLYLIPPVDFKNTNDFVGLKKDDYTTLKVNDVIDGNYYSLVNTFTKEEYEKQGIKVLDFQNIKVNNYPAKYLVTQNSPTQKGYAMIFGDESFVTMINVIYHSDEENIGKQVITSLNSIYYDKQEKVNPLETAFFSLDTKQSKFKFHQYNNNVYSYTVNGINTTNDNPSMLVMQMKKEDSSMTTKNIADWMIAKAPKYRFSQSSVQNISTQRINDYDSYEEEVYGQMDNKSTVIYECVLVKNKRIVIIQGTAKKDLQTNIKAFKALTNTIEIK